jgi:hypothetical protein
MVWDRNHISNLKKLIIFCVVMLVEWHMGVVVWWCDHKVTSAPWNNQCSYELFSFIMQKEGKWRHSFVTLSQNWVIRSFPRYGATRLW